MNWFFLDTTGIIYYRKTIMRQHGVLGSFVKALFDGFRIFFGKPARGSS